MGVLKICGCFALVVVALLVLSMLGGHAATPGAGIFQPMLDDCEINGNNCPELLFKFRAFQQIYVMDVDVANKYVPEGVELVSLFGKTLGAIFVVEYEWVSYSENPTSPKREVDVLQLLGKGPDGFMGAWASHVLLTDESLQRMGRREMGLPAEICDVQVTHNCPPADQSIVFHVGPDENVDKVEACLPLGPGEGWMDLTSLVNHTLPNLTGKIPKDLSKKLDALPHQDNPDDLTGLMMYLLTFYNADLKMAPSVSQRADVSRAQKDSKAGPLMQELLAGTVFPFSTVFDNVAATTWDTARLSAKGEWELDPYHHLADGSHIPVAGRVMSSTGSGVERVEL